MTNIQVISDYISGFWCLYCLKLAVNWKDGNGITLFWHDAWWNFCDAVLFLFLSLVAGPRFMSILPLVLELWQFPFIRDWSEIRKSQIPPSEFFPISRDWGEFGLPNLTRTSDKMLMNAAKCQGYSFYCFLFIKGTTNRGLKLPPPPPQD